MLMRVVLVAAALWASLAPAVARAQVAQATPPADAPVQEAPSTPAVPTPPAPGPAAEASATPAPPTATATPEADYLKFGMGLDAGIPDGAGLSGIYRPFTWLRANAGINWNYIGYGVHGGVSLVPFYFPITPSLNLEGGHFFETDATPFANQLLPGQDLSAVGDALRRVSYNYGNAQLGLEVGVPQRFIFSLRAGLSYLQTSIPIQQALQNIQGDTTIEAAPVTIKATLPSVKLGFILYL
jgi:hypothetical protein